MFHLLDSHSLGTFAHLALIWTPRNAALQGNIAATRDAKWEATSACPAVEHALRDRQGPPVTVAVAGVGRTVVESPIHALSDSRLLPDSMRVIDRLLAISQPLLGAGQLEEALVYWNINNRIPACRTHHEQVVAP